MNNDVLNIVVQDFINNNLNSDITSILLKKVTLEGVGTKTLVEQIESKKRCLNKLPTWFQTPGIYYPNKLNIEQTSSEITAAYKAKLISGHSIIDMTGGFGVDSYFFSKQFKSVVHCEVDPSLSKIAAHNSEVMEISNIDFMSEDGFNFLKVSERQFDWIYVDPSRRHGHKGKVFLLSDCEPNVPEELEILFAHSSSIMIKTSPLLDITAGIRDLKHVRAIHIVAVDNEVKELLWILKKTYNGEISIKTVNLKKASDEVFEFDLSAEGSVDVKLGEPLTYLYEPNAAILKAGAFNLLTGKLGVYKLHKHSHLYTSDTLIDFPGRRFKVEKVIPYHKRQLRRSLDFDKANVSTRNFPETVQQIRKKFKIRDGGHHYLFYTTNLNEDKIVIIASKSLSG